MCRPALRRALRAAAGGRGGRRTAAARGRTGRGARRARPADRHRAVGVGACRSGQPAARGRRRELHPPARGRRRLRALRRAGARPPAPGERRRWPARDEAVRVRDRRGAARARPPASRASSSNALDASAASSRSTASGLRGRTLPPRSSGPSASLRTCCCSTATARGADFCTAAVATACSCVASGDAPGRPAIRRWPAASSCSTASSAAASQRWLDAVARGRTTLVSATNRARREQRASRGGSRSARSASSSPAAAPAASRTSARWRARRGGLRVRPDRRLQHGLVHRGHGRARTPAGGDRGRCAKSSSAARRSTTTRCRGSP